MYKFIKHNLLLSLLVITLSANAFAEINIDFTLIKNNDDASLDEQCITYERINPAIYIVKADCEYGNYILSLKELYNPGWKVYFSLMSEESSKINYSIMERYVVEKLKNNKKIYQIDSKIKPSISDFILIPNDSHFRMNKIFNGWIIDSLLVEYLLTQYKIDKGLNNNKFTFYIVFYSEIIKQFWQMVMFVIIALLLIIFFTRKIIKKIY